MIAVLTAIALGLVALIAVEAWVFVARHAHTSWWVNREGRYLMKSKVGLALVFTMTLVFQVVQPKVETRLVASVLLFGWIAYTLGELLALQTIAKRERKRDAAKRAE